MVTVLTDTGEIEVAGAQRERDRLWLTEAELEAATGWSLRPEGLCRGDVCVPIPPGRAGEFRREGRVDAGALWRHLDKATLSSDDGSVWVLGEGARERGDALLSLTAPDFTLPDPAGRMHSLSEHRGKKVLLVSWASW
jgi:hypothetical protein